MNARQWALSALDQREFAALEIANWMEEKRKATSGMDFRTVPTISVVYG